MTISLALPRNHICHWVDDAQTPSFTKGEDRVSIYRYSLNEYHSTPWGPTPPESHHFQVPLFPYPYPTNPTGTEEAIHTMLDFVLDKSWQGTLHIVLGNSNRVGFFFAHT